MPSSTPSHSLEFLHEPAPRTIPNRATWAYATRNYRHRSTIVFGAGATLWLIFIAIGAPHGSPGKTFAVASALAGVLTLVFAVPTWLDARSKIRRIEQLLQTGALATGTLRIITPSRRRQAPRLVVAVRSRVVQRSRNEPGTEEHLATPLVSSFVPVGRELAELKSGDSVSVLLSEDPAVEDLVALVTDKVLCIGAVSSAANTRPRGLPAAWFLIGGALALVVPLAALCTTGALLTAVGTFFPHERAPFPNVAMGAFSMATLTLLAGYLLTSAWRLLGVLLRRKDAGYWFHPLVGVGLGGSLGLVGVAALLYRLVHDLRPSWALAFLPLVFICFAMQQARMHVQRKRLGKNRPGTRA